MEIAVLGPTEAHLPSGNADLGTPKQRALVAALALHLGRPVPVDTIADLLWGDAPPREVAASLQAYVSGLRRVLEPDRARRAPARLLVTEAPGYALRLPGDALDATRFECTITEAHRRLAVTDRLEEPELLGILTMLDEALALWRGTPYPELGDAVEAVADRARLEELRLVALEDRMVAELALGRHVTAAAELETLTARHPLRERLWALRALALTRSGRQAEALSVLAQVRGLLADELGLEPSTELRDLQTAVLRQDTTLQWVPPLPKPVSEPPAEPGRTVVGRDRELAALLDAFSSAARGEPAFAVLTGEPGIGKSRLLAELGDEVRARGARVLTGRGTQDDGAPPLWPWTTVLHELGAPLPEVDELDEGSRFRSWAEIVRIVAQAATDVPVVLCLDDFHWADPSSLRVLRLLVESARAGRLLVVTAWRPRPAPVGPLADVSEALTRRHAVRLELAGLGPAESAAVFADAGGSSPTVEQAEALRLRTSGNPFFLVEYARLTGPHGDIDRTLTDDPPSAVQEVIGRRLDRLPSETVAALRVAAVLGRSFDSATLAATAELDPDDLLDVIEPAQAAGLVTEDGVERFSFEHALVRDTLLAGLSASRRARTHARAARAIGSAAGRETELALHWCAAGPAHASRAWPAALAAAEVARSRHSHEEQAELLGKALDALEADPAARPRERYDTLLLLADAYRWSGMWPELTAAVEQAIDVAEAMDDPGAVAAAAIATTHGALWQVTVIGGLNEAIVAALHRSLERLPEGDTSLRCRALLSLAGHTYYVSQQHEREALVEQALAMAERIGDDLLLLDACQEAYTALWVGRTAAQRLALATRGLEIAERLGLDRGRVVSRTLQAIALGELGRPAEMHRVAARARQEAEEMRFSYAQLVLDGLEVPWRAMAGDRAAADALLGSMVELSAETTLEQATEAVVGAMTAHTLWLGDLSDAAEALRTLDDSALPLAATTVAFNCRAGQLDQARQHYAKHGVDLDHDDWFSPLNWSLAAESAAFLGEAGLASDAYQRLLPLAGHASCAGSGVAIGPTDAFLALAAYTVGDRRLAARHADDAERLCREWEIPLAAEWFRNQRARFGF